MSLMKILKSITPNIVSYGTQADIFARSLKELLILQH